jgi:hypothetical protein
MILSQIAFARGACGGLARILIPSAVNTASKEPVNWPARSRIRNLIGSRALAEVHQDVGRRLCRPRAVRVRVDAGEVNAAGAVLDDDQGIASPLEHGVHTKSAARMPRACAVRNCFHVGPVRRGAGPIPAACRICHKVEAAIGWPSLTSSPGTRPDGPRSDCPWRCG